MANWIIVTIGLTLIIAGTIVGLSTVYSNAKNGKDDRRVKGGAVIIVGPFPIILGSDSNVAKILLVLAIILVTVLISFYLLQFI